VGYPDPKYFDYAASCPPFQEALEKFREISTRHFANPSSSHRHGMNAQKEMLAVKKEFCEHFKFYEGRLLLCSSGTEANNTIIEGHIRRYPQARLLIAEDAHECIWYATKKYKGKTEVIPIDPSGHIDLNTFKKLALKDITMVCMNHASNELGTIHPVGSVAEFCSYHHIKLLIDGVQAIGNIQVDLSAIPCDYYTFSSHKFGGPRSSGGVLIRDDQIDPLLLGGTQEWNLRAGTENLPGLAASLLALEISKRNLRDEMSRQHKLKQHLIDKLIRILPETVINTPSESLPGMVSLSFPGQSSHQIIAGLSLSGFAVSAGSACHSNQEEPSRIILALGHKHHVAKGTVRISMGYGTTEEAVDSLTDAIITFVQDQN
jgi:cysteine desulfurase